MRIPPLPRLVLGASLLALTVSCGDSPTPSDPGTPIVTQTPENGVRLMLVSGGSQVGVPGMPLPAPIVVRVVDVSDRPVVGATLNFLVQTGGGTAAPAQAKTDSSGTASTVWTLGPQPGEQRLRIAGTGGTELTVTAASNPPAAVASVRVQPDSVFLQPGQTSAFSAQAFAADGQALTGRAVAWASLDSLVATVDAQGTVTAKADGSARIVATVEGVSGQSLVHVRTPSVAVARVVIQPDSLALRPGEQGDFSAFAFAADGQALTGRAVAWASLDSLVATVDAQGTVTARADGSARIVATVEGVSGQALVNVSTPRVAVARVVIQPDLLALRPGERGDFSAFAFAADGQALTGRAVAWASLDSLVATVDAQGTVTARADGTARIAATVEGVSGQARVHVRTPRVAVARVVIQPDSLALRPGERGGFAAFAFAADGQALTGRAVAWASLDSLVAMVDAQGTVTARADGTARITATVEGVSAQAMVHVSTPRAKVARVVIQPDSLVLRPGERGDFSAQAFAADGQLLTGRAVAWASLDSLVVTVDAQGTVTARADGYARIRATVEGVSAQALVHVRTPRAAVARVVIQPDSLALRPGERGDFSAQAFAADGQLLTGRAVAWASLDSLVATVDAQGTVTARADGYARIRATVEGVPAQALVAVSTPRATVARVVVQPDSLVLRPGASGNLSAIAYDAQGGVLTGRAVAWASSDAGVASVNGQGVVLGVAEGSARVTATVEGVSASVAVRVATPPPAAVARVEVQPDSVVLTPGEGVDFVATAYDARGNVLTGRSVTWSTSSSTVVAIRPGGLATGISEGIARVTATVEGVAGSAAVRVLPLSLTIEKISGDGQSAFFGQELPAPLVVRVMRGGSPVAGARVQWSAGAGGGFVVTHGTTESATGSVTGADGRATIRWYMGAGAASQVATASVEGGASVRFTASASRAPYGGGVDAVQMNPGRTWLEPGEDSHLYAAALRDGLAARWAVLTITVDNPDVIAVRVEPVGVSWAYVYFTALEPGVATITATADNGVRNQIPVQVWATGTRPNNPGGGGSAIVSPVGTKP